MAPRGLALSACLPLLLLLCPRPARSTCEPGTFDRGQGSCANCPPNTYSTRPDQLSCTPCIENHFLPHGNAQENLCQPCPSNQISSPGQACVCPTPDYHQSAQTKQCERWGNECNYRRQYRSYFLNAGACVNARTRCLPGQSDTSNCCALGLRSRHTFTTDATCFTDPSLHGGSCNTETHYTSQDWVLDPDGVVIRALECRRLDVCSDDQFELSPSGPRENRVCIFITRCHPVTEYASRNATDTSDTVCAARTACRYADGEVLLRMGGPYLDDTCAMRARCDSVFPRTFLRVLPKNATSPSVPGSTGECHAVTVCPPGSQTVSDPLRLQDDRCSVCPAGTASADGKSCMPCPSGLRFSGAVNQTRCSECTDCAQASITSGPLSCPPGEHCTAGTMQPCNSTHDSVCMQCPRQWYLSPGSRLCRPCAAGHFLLQASPTQYEAHRCVPCPANTFCEGTATFSPCPGLRAYSLSGAISFVPSSPLASSRVDACSCHDLGGFEGQGGSLSGCTACPDGTFSGPGDLHCLQCPVGSFSKATVLPDLYRCGSIEHNARLLGPDGSIIHPDPHERVCQVTVGAKSCTLCPTNSTRTPRAQSISDCTMCRNESFYDRGSGSCVPCSPPCRAPEFFEVGHCTDAADRRCHACNLSCSLPGQYIAGCPGSADPAQPALGCGLCTNLPVRNALFLPSHGAPVRSPHDCPWACDDGFYSPAGLNTCLQCTHFDLSTCPAGMIFSACTHDRDASCLLPCKNATKPLRHSLYIPTGGGALGPLPMVGKAEPNQGCLWACEAGFRLHATDGGLQACVAE